MNRDKVIIKTKEDKPRVVVDHLWRLPKVPESSADRPATDEQRARFLLAQKVLANRGYFSVDHRSNAYYMNPISPDTELRDGYHFTRHSPELMLDATRHTLGQTAARLSAMAENLPAAFRHPSEKIHTLLDELRPAES